MKHISILVALLFTSSATMASVTLNDDEDSYQAQRSIFVKAEIALKKGHKTTFKRLKKQLAAENYPLLPYLDYQSLRKRVSYLDQSDIESFEEAYPDSPLGQRLHRTWLYKLMKRGHWKKFLSGYSPEVTGSVTMQCYHRLSQYWAGNNEEAFNGVEKLWLVTKSQPRVCDKVFSKWNKEGLMSNDMVWQRINLAMQKGRTRLASYIGKTYLPASEQRKVKLLRKAHRKPESSFIESRIEQLSDNNSQIDKNILLHSLKRMAKKDPVKAANLWQSIDIEEHFEEGEIDKIESLLASEMVSDGFLDTLNTLPYLSDEMDDNEVLIEKSIRSALMQRDWNKVVSQIDKLDHLVRNQNVWQYWKARALQSMGKEEQAESIYLFLSQERDYYGFLSSDRLGLPYRFKDVPITNDQELMDNVASISGIKRAKELLKLNRLADARREWIHTIKDLDEDHLLQASRLAHKWGWHNRAIMTVAKTKHRNDLELRFPLAYTKNVNQHSASNQIPAAWVYAVMRQESAFTVDARSPVGALGLMQVMPRTGKQTARKLKMRYRKSRQLIDADTNVRIGTSYLRTVYDRLHANPVLATAAYNAGPYRVKTWLPEHFSLPADIWIENIPYKETRNYLKNIMAYFVVYAHRTGNSDMSLQAMMPPIPAQHSTRLTKNEVTLTDPS